MARFSSSAATRAETCAIRDCVRGKGYYLCHQCNEHPCKFVNNFPMPVGVKVMHRAIPEWRGLWCCEKQRQIISSSD
ncbi:MAG: DUF3795 domain-containing protein [Candidatus Lokiarchaeota archaeon]|nr:DUF3795 domain-containing protein [Candidatus Lokiarchaeota archaeon]